MAKSKNVEQAVGALALPIAEQLGVDLWDVRFVKEGSEYYLRITLDKDGGIDICDCEQFSRTIDPLLDEADPIDVSYCLEVSSPGLGRPLTRPEHFVKSVGEEIRVGLYQPKDGKKEWVGTLASYADDGTVVLTADNGQITLTKSEISSAKRNDDADLFASTNRKDEK